MHRVLLPIALTAVIVATSAAQSDPREYFATQVQNYWRALRDPSTNSRVQRIWLDLVAYSGLMRPVVPAKQFNAGQALPNGVVLLDLSIAGDPNENVTAFWLGHEYGHQVLGHPQLGMTPWGQFLAMRAGTSNEDSADRWAARFLKAKGYDVAPVVAFLCGVPSAPNDSHSTGLERAAAVARAYGGGAADCDDRNAGRNSSGARIRSSSRRVPCQHRLQCGHQVECVHRGGCVHRIPCQHVFMTQFGPRVQHPFDTLHAFDSAHPFDTVHPFDTLHEYDEIG